MKLTLDELLAQREQVARHLAWLDAKIINLRADAASSVSPQPQQPVAQPQPVYQPQSSQQQAQAAPPASADAAAIAEQQAELLLRSPSGGVSSGFKFGCVLTAIITLLLSIGSFIAVSYLLYGGDK